MPRTKKIPMRTRRLISLTVSGSLVAAVGLGFGVPQVFEGENVAVANIDQPLDLLKPKGIFDPPQFSLDEPDSLWVVVNKQRPLAKKRYTPKELVVPEFRKPSVQNPSGLKLRKEAAEAATKMAVAMQKAGKGRLILNSGFRSFKTQASLYKRTVATKGFAVAEKLSARPSFSEHQTGLAADFAASGQGCVIMVCFGKTEAGIWLSNNAHNFGFILRYPAGYRAITGFQYEPWHFRYVGVELANELKNSGIETLEEFWKLDRAPDYLD